MEAIILKDFGGVENLISAELDIPNIKPDEVLVGIKSISINPIDVKTRAGKGVAPILKEQQPIILGWDISGIVEDIGAEVTAFKLGDEVFGTIAFPNAGKAYATYVAALASELAIKPSNITHDAAAAATLAALTAWQALTNYGSLNKGDRVLIHAASGGVGHYAVQIAKHFGAYVIGTSSSQNKDFVLSLGADQHIDYKAGPFENTVEDIDFVLDTIGGDNIDASLSVMKTGGTIVSIPSGLNEQVVEKANSSGKHGYTMKMKPGGTDMKTIAGFLEQGIIKSHVSKTFTFDQMAEAHLQLESGRTVGKITLKV